MANSQVKKFCTDCKWVSSKDESPMGWVCTQPKIEEKQTFNLVTGKAYANYCSVVRSGDDCGPAGKLWEPAEIIMDQ